MPTDNFIQYGCLGLVAFAWVVTLWKLIPTMMERHEKQVSATAEAYTVQVAGMIASHAAQVQVLVNALTVEQSSCREERIAAAALAAKDRETIRKDFIAESDADRTARHEAVERYTSIVSKQFMDMVAHKVSLTRSGDA